jgi:predicted RecB family nuclease
MKFKGSAIRLAATDLSNHLACTHVTTLDLQVARGQRRAPDWAAPDLVVIQERGRRHEEAFLTHLAQQRKMSVVNLAEIKDENELLAQTQKLMEQGAEAIAQGALQDGDWFGRPDVLWRVPKQGTKWDWSYEAVDTKLARETKAATILQLGLYSELLESVQGCAPDWMWVVPPSPDFRGEAYRVAEYAAYFRYVQRELINAVQNGGAGRTYPEPVAHCDVCRWFRECDAQRRADDHLSLVAGIRRQQRDQLEEWNTDTMAKLARLPIPLKQKPLHGSREAIERVREQARVQVQARTDDKRIHEQLLPIEAGTGLCRLPEPSPADVFLDLEGDPFVGESGLQYLFGFAFVKAGELKYEKRWALNRDEEKHGFEWLVDEIMRKRESNPRMHVYHFGAYEPAALKRLMGMYATREDEIDRTLRAGVMVDLHQAFKQSTLASVEEYSLKKIEVFYEFKRKTPLDESRLAMRYVEHRLELGWGKEDLPADTREVMEGYNSEDCFSTARLRDWLEEQRSKLIAHGTDVPRFVDRNEAASEELDERQKRVAALVEKLTAKIPVDPQNRGEEQQATWLLRNYWIGIDARRRRPIGRVTTSQIWTTRNYWRNGQD